MIAPALRLTALCILTLAACKNDAPPLATNEPSPAAPEEQSCAAERVTPLIGQLQNVLDSLDLPEPVRVISPGMAVTQDYRPDRTNIDIGQDGRILRVWCG